MAVTCSSPLRAFPSGGREPPVNFPTLGSSPVQSLPVNRTRRLIPATSIRQRDPGDRDRDGFLNRETIETTVPGALYHRESR